MASINFDYEPAQYTISYNANGGSNAPASQTKIHGTTLTLTSEIPDPPAASSSTITLTYAANGGSSTPSPQIGTVTTPKVFNKWTTESDGSGDSYAPGASYTSNSAVTLYAQWKDGAKQGASITTRAKISRANDSVTGPVVSFNSNVSTVTAPAAITSTKTRKYTFTHWLSGSGTSLNASTAYTFTTSNTLTAQWSSSDTQNAITLPSAITRPNGSNITGYIVTFDSNGSTTTAPSAITSTRTPKYAFVGWNTESDGSGANYLAEQSYTPSAATTLHAQWTTSYQNNAITLPAAITRSNTAATAYTVTLNANGGSCSTTSLSAARTTSYTFEGWNTNSKGTGTTYPANNSYTPSAATTLYAKWSSSTSTASVTLPTPTKNGYVFKGWGTTSTSTNGLTGSYTPTGNVTLYAVWEPNKVSIYDNTNKFNLYNIMIANEQGKFEQYISFIYDGTKWVHILEKIINFKRDK